MANSNSFIIREREDVWEITTHYRAAVSLRAKFPAFIRRAFIFLFLFLFNGLELLVELRQLTNQSIDNGER